MPTSFAPTGFPSNWSQLSEQEKRGQWRFEYARALGFDEETITTVVDSGVDLHDLEVLIRGGCPPLMAFLILW